MMKIQTKHYLAIANVSIQVFLVVNIIVILVSKGTSYFGGVALLMSYQFVTAIIGGALQNKWRIDSIAIWFTMLMGIVLFSLVVSIVGIAVKLGNDLMDFLFPLYGILLFIIAPLVYFIYSIRELAYFHKHPDRIQEGNRELFEDILDADDI